MHEFEENKRYVPQPDRRRNPRPHCLCARKIRGGAPSLRPGAAADPGGTGQDRSEADARALADAEALTCPA